MTRFIKPRSLYLAGLGLLAIVTVDVWRRLRKSEAADVQMAPPAERTAQKAQPAEPTPKKAAVKAKGDDLTQIKGIGPTYAKRLEDAGLTTYSDIANASADQLRDITRATGATADPTDWISQARSLNGH